MNSTLPNDEQPQGSKHFRAVTIKNHLTGSDVSMYVEMLDSWTLQRKYEYNHENTDLWGDLHAFIRDEFPTLDIRSWKDEDGETNVWWIQKHDCIEVAEKVMTRLDHFVETRVLPHKVPTLVRIVCEALENRKAFAKSLLEHQRKFGYHQTDSVVYTYFHDILDNKSLSL